MARSIASALGIMFLAMGAYAQTGMPISGVPQRTYPLTVGDPGAYLLQLLLTPPECRGPMTRIAENTGEVIHIPLRTNQDTGSFYVKRMRRNTDPASDLWDVRNVDEHGYEDPWSGNQYLGAVGAFFLSRIKGQSAIGHDPNLTQWDMILLEYRFPAPPCDVTLRWEAWPALETDAETWNSGWASVEFVAYEPEVDSRGDWIGAPGPDGFETTLDQLKWVLEAYGVNFFPALTEDFDSEPVFRITSGNVLVAEERVGKMSGEFDVDAGQETKVYIGLRSRVDAWGRRSYAGVPSWGRFRGDQWHPHSHAMFQVIGDEDGSLTYNGVRFTTTPR